jgi:hypothetical protein
MIYTKETTYEDLERRVKEAGTAYAALTDLIVELAPYWYDRRVAGKPEEEPWADMRVLKETIDRLYAIRDNLTEKPLIMKRRPVCCDSRLHSQIVRKNTEATKTEETKTEAAETEKPDRSKKKTKTEATKEA